MRQKMKDYGRRVDEREKTERGDVLMRLERENKGDSRNDVTTHFID